MGTCIMDGTTQRFPQGGLEGKETFCFRSQEKNVLDIPSYRSGVTVEKLVFRSSRQKLRDRKCLRI